MLKRRRWGAAAVVHVLAGLALFLVALTVNLATVQVQIPMSWRILTIAAGILLFIGGVLTTIAFGDALATLLRYARRINSSLVSQNATIRQQAELVRSLESELKGYGKHLDALDCSLATHVAMQGTFAADLAAFRESTAERQLDMVDWLEELEKLVASRDGGSGPKQPPVHYPANGVGEHDHPNICQQAMKGARWISESSFQPRFDGRSAG